jgi:hypothetical protein
MPHLDDFARHLAQALSEVCFGSDEEFPVTHGRLHWVEEVARIIDGDPDSADIASAR